VRHQRGVRRLDGSGGACGTTSRYEYHAKFLLGVATFTLWKRRRTAHLSQAVSCAFCSQPPGHLCMPSALACLTPPLHWLHACVPPYLLLHLRCCALRGVQPFAAGFSSLPSVKTPPRRPPSRLTSGGCCKRVRRHGRDERRAGQASGLRDEGGRAEGGLKTGDSGRGNMAHAAGRLWNWRPPATLFYLLSMAVSFRALASRRRTAAATRAPFDISVPGGTAGTAAGRTHLNCAGGCTFAACTSKICFTLFKGGTGVEGAYGGPSRLLLLRAARVILETAAFCLACMPLLPARRARCVLQRHRSGRALYFLVLPAGVRAALALTAYHAVADRATNCHRWRGMAGLPSAQYAA